MIRIKKLDHVVIRAKDAERLIEFYRNLLGCMVEGRSLPEIGIVSLTPLVSVQLSKVFKFWLVPFGGRGSHMRAFPF
jgi:catechol 2,3-dioxygenase-like lactoylglutathione lyase family enzyme